MTTSGTITAFSTVRDLIKGSLELIGVDDNHEDGDSYATAMRHLGWMLKEWQAEGCNLWRETEIAITWTAGNQSQVITPNIMDVMDARVLLSATNERQLGRFERGDYNSLPNKAASGTPTIYSFKKDVASVKMYVWPVPAVTTTINATVARIIDDVTSINQTLDVPQEWQSCVVYNLAARLLDPFSVPISQPPVAQRVTAMASALYQKLLNFDRPSSIFMKPWGRA